MSNEQQSKKIGEIMNKCWTDESFKRRLLSDANATLQAEGVVLPAGIKVNVLENTGTVINYILPENPQAELSDADLDKVAGGGKAGVMPVFRETLPDYGVIVIGDPSSKTAEKLNLKE